MSVVITQFWVILQNSFFFKIKKIIIKAGNVEKVSQEVKLQFLKEIQDLIVPHYAQK